MCNHLPHGNCNTENVRKLYFNYNALLIDNHDDYQIYTHGTK